MEAQASERIPAPASDASATTIESLRARLLSERAASKEARQQAQQIAEKVSELHARLDVEIECRKKAEAAMDEVLEALKAKGLAMEQVIFTASLPLENLEGEEMVLVNGYKDVESEPSSGEESCHALMEEKHPDLDDRLNTHPTHGHDTTQERHASGDDSLSETQCNLKETTENDLSVVDNCSVNCDDRDFSHRHDVNTGHIKDIGNGSLSAGRRPEESSKGYSDQSCLLEPGRILSDSEKHAEGPVKLECNVETGLTSGNELPGLTSSDQMVVHQEVDRKAESDASLSNGHWVYALANGAYRPDDCLSPRKFDDLIGHAGKTRQHAHWLQQDEISQCQMPSTKSLAGFRPKETHPDFSPINGLPYDVTNTNGDHWMYDVSTGETPFGRNRYADYKMRHAYFPSTAYQSTDPLRSETSGFNRPPGAHINDSILALVDDKNGKLGDILMALHLAKQQLRDEGHNSSYTEEKHEPSTPTAADGKAYVGYHGDGLYQPPYHCKRPEVHSQAPIIHLPASPISDHGFSAFERHDGLRRSSSVSANFMMPWSEAHIQPRGELHLGNGITLYTD